MLTIDAYLKKDNIKRYTSVYNCFYNIKNHFESVKRKVQHNKKAKHQDPQLDTKTLYCLTNIELFLFVFFFSQNRNENQ